MNINNVNENIINVITIVLICISLVLISPCFLSKSIERFVMSEPYSLPKVIIQTYYSKHKIPQKVYRNIKKFSSGYKHLVFDDQDCIQFLNKEYGQQVLDKFKSLKVGAHKSDLFRYCYFRLSKFFYDHRAGQSISSIQYGSVNRTTCKLDKRLH